jgi:hypothetical protein
MNDYKTCNDCDGRMIKSKAEITTAISNWWKCCDCGRQERNIDGTSAADKPIVVVWYGVE